MYRHIYQDLLLWKEGETRKPLILKGVRQCGKTWLLKTFAAEHFEDVAYFNFEGNDSLQVCFTRDMNTERILKELGQIRRKSIDLKKTVVIFDEIQFCPAALTSLKYFFENMPELPIMCQVHSLGSLLQNPSPFQ
ncbi:AAA family ATPase [uncultured Methanocorpusculum sp.]|nr:AAA family ATPase [uncultured Methanocorpusculum sp.]